LGIERGSRVGPEDDVVEEADTKEPESAMVETRESIKIRVARLDFIFSFPIFFGNPLDWAIAG
jgi:hypothetical protein